MINVLNARRNPKDGATCSHQVSFPSALSFEKCRLWKIGVNAFTSCPYVLLTSSLGAPSTPFVAFVFLDETTLRHKVRLFLAAEINVVRRILSWGAGALLVHQNDILYYLVGETFVLAAHSSTNHSTWNMETYPPNITLSNQSIPVTIVIYAQKA